MKIIHTHTFIGGPADGTKMVVADGDERAYVQLPPTPGAYLSRAAAPDASVAVAIERRVYTKGQFRAGKTTFLYWRDEALDDEAVIAKLFDRYVLTKGEG